ncbi:D-alanyl-D-alanine carboxypeptidase/D-alanyl-D-alanine endopeptidase [Longispora albida]|uniref:D-alanyl-D-alanine carboxypeptidase/D-alanyl-D-alanine endopeptidase n=1 Tax=Longispora albida TaxID=203523 RepID=UPI00036FD206|nr:D-alanyl-D-alanine carboxypeptidase/D-alanyl-D-alanine-endopeptidase [Longispora albida]
MEQKPRKGRWIAAFAAVTVLGAAGGAAVALDPLAEQPKLSFWAGLPADAAPAAVLDPGKKDAPAVTPAAVNAAISAAIADPRLGTKVSAVVVDLATGEKLYDRAADTSLTPASTIKLSTSAAVLITRGPEYRIETRVVAGPNPGEVIIIGGGDTTLSVDGNGAYPGAAKLSDLAEQVKKNNGGQPVTKVIVDGTLFPGPAAGPGWLPADLTEGWVTNVTALATDGARVDPKGGKGTPRHLDASAVAGAQFAKLLGLPASAVSTGKAAPEAKELGKVYSPTIARLVEYSLTTSDNMVAEVLARQVALARGKPASYEGASEAIKEALTGLGLTPPVQVDGSGMSARNKVSPNFYGALLVLAAKPDRPELRTLFTGLPVAGYSGTLDDRYPTTSDGAGVVRAKTGTLSGVDSLAGIVTTRGGRQLGFAIMASDTPNMDQARAALDKVAVLLARLP